MKFNIIALAGVLASANAHQLRTNVRKLEGARADLDGTANISFAKCIEVTVQPDDDEDLQAAILAGTAKPVKSYAAFYTSNYAKADEMMMVGLGDYVAAKVKASAMKSQNFCESCREFEETCNVEEEEVEEEAAEEEGAEEAEEGEDAEEGEGEGENRKLATAIDSSFCNQCQTQGCYVEEEENGQVDYKEELAEFIEQAAECMQVENYQDANGNSAYIGMACGSYGDAAEFAVFLDEDCTIETNQVSAATVLSSAGANEDGASMVQLMAFAGMYMQEAFTTKLSCEQVEYYDPNNADEENEDGQDENADQVVEMNETCEQITDEAVYIADCAAEDAAEEDEAAEEEEQWYDFDVQDGGDIDEVCAIVNYKMNNKEKFDYFYNEKTQGTSYKRNITGSLKKSNNGMSGGLIFLIVALVIGAAMLIHSKMSSNKAQKQDHYYGESLSHASDADSVGGYSRGSMKGTAYKYKHFFMLYIKKLKAKFSRG